MYVELVGNGYSQLHEKEFYFTLIRLKKEWWVRS